MQLLEKQHQEQQERLKQQQLLREQQHLDQQHNITIIQSQPSHSQRSHQGSFSFDDPVTQMNMISSFQPYTAAGDATKLNSTTPSDEGQSHSHSHSTIVRHNTSISKQALTNSDSSMNDAEFMLPLTTFEQRVHTSSSVIGQNSTAGPQIVINPGSTQIINTGGSSVHNPQSPIPDSTNSRSHGFNVGQATVVDTGSLVRTIRIKKIDDQLMNQQSNSTQAEPLQHNNPNNALQQQQPQQQPYNSNLASQLNPVETQPGMATMKSFSISNQGVVYSGGAATDQTDGPSSRNLVQATASGITTVRVAASADPGSTSGTLSRGTATLKHNQTVNQSQQHGNTQVYVRQPHGCIPTPTAFSSQLPSHMPASSVFNFQSTGTVKVSTIKAKGGFSVK